MTCETEPSGIDAAGWLLYQMLLNRGSGGAGGGGGGGCRGGM